MFYLEQFFKSFKDYPVRSGLFTLFTVLLILFVGHHQVLEGRFEKVVASKQDKAHFQALVSKSQNIDTIRRKVKSLPGIDAIRLMDYKQIKMKVEKLLGELAGEISDELMDLDYSGVEIYFKSSTSEKSQRLIQDYIVRLVGSSEVILGPIVSAKSRGIVSLFSAFGKWSLNFLGLIIGVGWLIVAFLYSKALEQPVYMIERFQRKKFVGVKIYFCALLVIWPLACIPVAMTNLNLLTYQIIVGFFFSVGSLFHFNKLRRR